MANAREGPFKVPSVPFCARATHHQRTCPPAPNDGHGTHVLVGVGSLGDDERPELLPAADHGDVELCRRQLVVDEHERLVARRALGLVDRERVGEANVAGDVVGRQAHGSPDAGERLDLQRADLVSRDDAPACAVSDEVTLAASKRPVVAQRHHLVAHPGDAGSDGDAIALHLARANPLGPTAP